MKSSAIKGGIKSLALVLSFAQIASLSLLPVSAADNKVRIAGIPVITLSVSSTARAEQIQHNIDNSLVAASNHGPSSIKITYVKGLPVLTLGGYYVATVDNATAKAAGSTPTLLAQKWANSLKTALANKTSTDAYIAQLSGKTTSTAGSAVASSASSSSYTPSTAPKYDSSSSSSRSSELGWQTMPAGNPVASTSSYSDYVAYGQSGNKPYQGRVTYIPAGMTIPAKLMTSLSSQLAKSGDTVMAKTTQDIVLSDGVIPANSTLIGQVTEAAGGSRLAKSGSLTIKFNTLRTPTGQETPISAHINGNVGKYAERGGDNLRGENTMSKVKTSLVHTAIGAGGGTALGLAIGAIAGGGRGVGRGAWSGAAIGAGLGLAESLLVRKGREVILTQGEKISLQLDAPVTMAMN